MTTTRVPSPSPYAPTIGFSAAVRAGDWVHVSGTTAVNEHGEIVGGEDPAAQTREIVRKLTAALDAAGAGLEHVVRTRMYLVDPADIPAVTAVHGDLFRHVRPAATLVIVAGLMTLSLRVEVEADAVRSRPTP